MLMLFSYSSCNGLTWAVFFSKKKRQLVDYRNTLDDVTPVTGAGF